MLVLAATFDKSNHWEECQVCQPIGGPLSSTVSTPLNLLGTPCTSCILWCDWLSDCCKIWGFSTAVSFAYSVIIFSRESNSIIANVSLSNPLFCKYCQAQVPGLTYWKVKHLREKLKSHKESQKGTKADAIIQIHHPPTHPLTLQS